MKTLTRREVIEAWNKDERYHDYFVCPDCRDILKCKDTDVKGIILQCDNEKCDNTHVYNILTGEEILL